MFSPWTGQSGRGWTRWPVSWRRPRTRNCRYGPVGSSRRARVLLPVLPAAGLAASPAPSHSPLSHAAPHCLQLTLSPLFMAVQHMQHNLRFVELIRALFKSYVVVSYVTDAGEFKVDPSRARNILLLHKLVNCILSFIYHGFWCL